MKGYMENKIEIIDSSLVNGRRDLLNFIDYWKAVLGIKIGWHYDLDLIWIMERLEEMKLPKGAHILDAGAGNGLLQFLLAAKGYNVDSVDFADRDIIWGAKKIFNVTKDDTDKEVRDDHRYQNFIDHKKKHIDLQRIYRLLKNPSHVAYRIGDEISILLNPKRWSEILFPKKYGSVNYKRGDFTNLNKIPDDSYDCVVSVSAIEHNDPGDAKKAISELERVAKKGGGLVITTSASRDKDWYMKECQGLCFTYQTLVSLFNMNEYSHNYNEYDKLFERLIQNQTIRKRIPRLYYENGDNGLPWGKYPPKYQPVGVLKIKDQI